MQSWQFARESISVTGRIPSQRTSNVHYCDVIMGAMASQITSLTIGLFTQTFIKAQIEENIKALRHWPLCMEFTGHRWIPRTYGQLRGKCFHLMASSCESASMPWRHLKSRGYLNKYYRRWSNHPAVSILNSVSSADYITACLKQVPKAGTSNYISQYLWDLSLAALDTCSWHNIFK